MISKLEIVLVGPVTDACRPKEVWYGATCTVMTVSVADVMDALQMLVTTVGALHVHVSVAPDIGAAAPARLNAAENPPVHTLGVEYVTSEHDSGGGAVVVSAGPHGTPLMTKPPAVVTAPAVLVWKPNALLADVVVVTVMLVLVDDTTFAFHMLVMAVASDHDHASVVGGA